VESMGTSTDAVFAKKIYLVAAWIEVATPKLEVGNN
jgi:hypothetical protein